MNNAKVWPYWHTQHGSMMLSQGPQGPQGPQGRPLTQAQREALKSLIAAAATLARTMELEAFLTEARAAWCKANKE